MKDKKRRALQLAEVTKRVLGTCLQEYPILDSAGASIPITITQVVLSNDYGWADVFVAPLYGVQKSADVVLEALKGHGKFLRKYLAHNACMKRTPQLRFIYDESFDRAMRCEQLLDADKN